MRVASLIVSFLIATTSFASSTVPFMNLLDYRAELLQARGQLPPQATCAMDLRVRPALRGAVLSGGKDFSWFTSATNYSGAEKQADFAWVQDQQLGIEGQESKIMLALQNQGVDASPWIKPADRPLLGQFGLYPGFYNLSDYASYQIGPVAMPWYESNGFVYKVFFEFQNPLTDLTADRYLAFSQQLQAAGFQGDSKVPMVSGWIRFTWNNIIVHAPTEASALIAEQVGLAAFGPYLASHSRGLDVKNAFSGGKPLDWPDFLCIEDPAKLPTDVAAYVNNQ